MCVSDIRDRRSTVNSITADTQAKILKKKNKKKKKKKKMCHPSFLSKTLCVYEVHSSFKLYVVVN